MPSRFELKKAEASRRLALSKVDQEIEQERIAVANTENAMLGAFKKSAGRVEEPENRRCPSRRSFDCRPASTDRERYELQRRPALPAG